MDDVCTKTGTGRLDGVLCTGELDRRPARPPDYATESRALKALAQALADSPSTILHNLTDITLATFAAGSAGVSLMRDRQGGPGPGAPGDFYWVAVSGVWADKIGSGTPRQFGPCGEVLNQNRPQLFIHPKLYYPYLETVTPPACEALLAPFYVNGIAVGTVWVVAHDDTRKFDAEDLRILTSVSQFAAGAYQAWRAIDANARELHATQQQLEEELRRKAEEFSAHFSLSTVGNAQCDAATGRLLLVNSTLCAMAGYSEAELLGKTFLELTHADDRAETQRLYSELMLGARTSFEIEKRMLCKSGEVRWTAVSVAVAQWDAEHRPLRAGAVLVDISNRRHAEMARGEMAERYVEQARIFDRTLASITDFAYMFDLDGRFSFANRPLLQLLGITLDGIVGKNFFDLNYPDELAARLQVQIQQVIATREPVVGETPFTSPTGYDGYYQYIFSPILNDMGAVEAVAGCTRDYTERKRTEEELRRSEERYRTLFESMEQGFCVIETILDANQACVDYRFIEINPAFEKHSGIENALGKRMLELIPDIETTWFETYGQVAQTGERVRFVRESSHLRGRWYDVYAFRLGGNGSRKVAVFFSDISERRKNEDELRSADRRKDEFLAVVSHELRTPLTAMLGWIKMLRTNKVPREKIAYALEVIERNVKVQTQLIEDLLDISRIITGKLHLSVQPLDIKGVIEAAIESVRPSFESKKLTLVTHFEPVSIAGDQDRLQQIVWNLLSNAIKFTPTGGQIEIAVSLANSKACIMVRDNGKGINAEFLPLIFNRFQQADVGITRNFGGLGLGLSIVRHLVELHGGTIRVSSPGADQGATFTIEFPIPVFTHYPATKTPQSGVHPALRLAGLHVLIVDDEPDTRDLLEFALQGDGAQVITTSSVAEAIEHFNQLRPHIVISDISMPIEDGYSLIRRIRLLPDADGGNTPVLALTAFAHANDQQRMLKAGFNAYAAKPIDPKILTTMVAEIAAAGPTANA